MSDSVRPHRRQSTRLCRPWDSPGKNTGVGCHFLLQCMKVKSEVAQSLSRIRPFATPWTAAYQAPLSIGFSRQEYWSGLPLPSPSSPAPQLKSVSSSALSLLYGPTMYMCVCMLICFVSNSAVLWTVACQAPLAMGLSRQE